MAVLGRILQAIGWVWLLAGFFGNFINLPFGNVVPGIILLFVSRIIRAQAGRRERDEEPDIETETQSIPLDTPSSGRRVPSMRPPPTSAEPASPSSRPAKDEPDERQEILEQILLAGTELEDDLGPRVIEAQSEMAEGDVRLSSAEMIARARQRWDRRP